MCGIAGLWARSSAIDSRELVRAMGSKLQHRGPDGEGVWSDGAVALGHRRLSIVDLSPAGAQPMTSASRRYVIAFNGEVYNHGRLRERLEREASAPAWKGHSDTEVMLAAIEAWGLERAVQQFLGMFAFALWDSQEHRLHLVRDRLGVKPLYWTRGSFGVAFASELKALRAVPGFETRLDHTAVAQYFEVSCVPGTRSIFTGTWKLEPGTIATFASPEAPPSVNRYWSGLEAARSGIAHPDGGSEAEQLDALDALLRDAVALRMVADVPLGAFLSGGVDSSLVVALMQHQSARPVHTFSIENEDRAFDEGPMARAVARHLGTHHTPFRVTAQDALNVIPSLPQMYDEPFADSSQIPTYLVASLARRDVTVALSGDGGDELFGGYTRHIWGARLAGLQTGVPRPARRAFAKLVTRVAPGRWDRVFGAIPGLKRVRIPGLRMHKFAAALPAKNTAAIYRQLTTHWSNAEGLLAGPRAQRTDELLLPARSATEEFMLRDLLGYLPDDILTKVDRASMAVSLEAREPLLDHRLVEFAWRLPLQMRVRGRTGKWALRQVLARYVPASIISGPKMGFAIPLGDWLRGPLRDWAEALLEPRRLSEGGLINPQVVRGRWQECLAGTHPWEFLLWDVLMFQAWREAQRV